MTLWRLGPGDKWSKTNQICHTQCQGQGPGMPRARAERGLLTLRISRPSAIWIEKPWPSQRVPLSNRTRPWDRHSKWVPSVDHLLAQGGSNHLARGQVFHLRWLMWKGRTPLAVKRTLRYLLLLWAIKIEILDGTKPRMTKLLASTRRS